MAQSQKNLDRLIKELKAGLLQKDARIEELELGYRQLRAENQQLRAQIELNPVELNPGEIPSLPSQEMDAGRNEIEASVG